MGEVTTIGLDIAKSVFQAHGSDASGSVVFRKKLSRGRLLAFFASQPPCVVAMEACAGAHHWGRELTALGHTIRLIPPAYVKPFVKRQKNDEADAEAICEAAQRPTMRFVPVKTEAQQASGVVFRARDLLVRQRTQISNAIRGHLAEYGHVAPKGVCYVEGLIERIDSLPDAAQPALQALVEAMRALEAQIAVLDREIALRAKEDGTARRLMTIPGIGPVTAAALTALAPDPQAFRCGRELRRLARAHAAAEVHWRQGEARPDHQDGRANAEAAPGDRGQRGDQAGAAQRRAAGIVAGADAGQETPDAGGGGPGQQDGPRRLGAAGQGRDLQGSGAGGLTAISVRGVEA
jgi:transposase